MQLVFQILEHLTYAIIHSIVSRTMFINWPLCVSPESHFPKYSKLKFSLLYCLYNPSTIVIEV